MDIRTDWLLVVTATDDENHVDAPFVEITDIGIPDFDEIRIRKGNGVCRPIERDGEYFMVYNRDGLHLLREAIDEYLLRAAERDEEEA